MAIPLPGQVIDIAKLFQDTFGTKPFYLPPKDKEKEVPPGEYIIKGAPHYKGLDAFTDKGYLIAEKYLGVDIFLPIRFYDSNSSKLLMYLPYCVIRIAGKKTIIKTALAERRGTVKEQYNVDDYSISIKGFLIGQNRKFPELEIDTLKDLFETKTAVTIDNALTDIFLTGPGLKHDEQKRVVIMNFELPEVQGGRIHVKPFTMELESDSVFTLEFDDIKSI